MMDSQALYIKNIKKNKIMVKKCCISEKKCTFAKSISLLKRGFYGSLCQCIRFMLIFGIYIEPAK